MAIEKRTFTSKHSQLRLPRKQEIPNYNALGQRQGYLQKALCYTFKEVGHGYGTLELTVGQDMLPDGPLDEKGQPTMQDAVSWVRSLPEYNNPGMMGGFVEDGLEPGAIPSPMDVLDDITEAGVTLDPGRIEAILDEEREGYQREVVLTLGERTLEKVNRQLASEDAKNAAAKKKEAAPA